MTNINISLDGEIKTYLERLTYEEGGLREVLVTLIEHNQDDSTFLSSPLFTEYLNQYQKSFIELNILRQEVIDMYIPKETVGHNYTWELRISDGILRFIIQDDREVTS